MTAHPLRALLLSLALAMLVLVAVVLPAEFNQDPLGTGAALGLLGLAGEPQALSVRPAQGALASDVRQFELAPFESTEVKYRLKAGGTLVFRWQSSAEVLFDLHAVPDGAADGYAEGYASGRALADAGAYAASFDGIHGWFFENRGDTTLTLLLEVAGFTTEAVVYRDGYPDRYPLGEQSPLGPSEEGGQP